MTAVSVHGPAARACLDRYFDELASRFPEGFDRQTDDAAALEDYSPPGPTGVREVRARHPAVRRRVSDRRSLSSAYMSVTSVGMRTLIILPVGGNGQPGVPQSLRPVATDTTVPSSSTSSVSSIGRQQTWQSSM